MSEDIMFFDISDDDVDLFGEETALETDSESQKDKLKTELDPEFVQESVQEFRKLFTERDGSLSVGSGALIIYQHLIAAGYECAIAVEDKGAEVTAKTSHDTLKTAMVDRVEDLLDEMVFLEHDWKTDHFTVTSITTHSQGAELIVTIKFKTV